MGQITELRRRAANAYRRFIRNIKWKRNRARHRRVFASVERRGCACGLNRAPRETEIVLSMTSYPKRFLTLDKVIMRLLDQTVKPDRFVLYLDDCVKPEDVPEAVRALVPYGLEIRFRPHNLKPHGKYLFAMQEFPDALIVTVDDDFIYPRTLIEALYSSWQRFPDCVCAMRAHKITFTDAGTIMPYTRWEWECAERNQPAMCYLATGCGGVLYPPRSLPPETFNIERIRELALSNDDIWLKFMQRRIGTKVVICDTLEKIRSFEITLGGSGLKYTNVSDGVNDQIIADMMASEGAAPGDFMR